MKKICLMVWMVGMGLGSPGLAGELRLPAVPLVTHDPYFSVWCTTDRLYDDWTRHWTLKPMGMCGMIRVDGKAMKFLGNTTETNATVKQTSVVVRATQTIYTFDAAGVKLTVSFTSPLLMDDLDLMSRPATYVTMDVVATDGKQHDVQLYFDASGEWAVNKPVQKVKWGRREVEGMEVMSMGSVDQKILGSKGDDHRIDWGYLLLAGPKGQAVARITDDKSARSGFILEGKVAPVEDAGAPRAVEDHWPVLSMVLDAGKVGETSVRKHVILAYDDIESIQYFGKNLKAWWRRGAGMTAEKMLAMAEKEYESVLKRCDAFDKKLVEDLSVCGSEQYTQMCVAVYRQAIAAHKLVASPEGKPLFFSKECNSNGSIGTVDVTYPSAPLFLIYNPELLKGMLEPIFDYVESGKWTKPIAPHDVGTYPLANGQTYGTDMPVEECGNMVVLTAAVCAAEGKADYAKSHWQTLTKWVDYLQQKGLDPANQLCTDDFAGHLAHNANLSIKAIVAIGAYGQMAGLSGNPAKRENYYAIAREMAGKWANLARDNDHYVLAFGKPGTWSQKYNLVWDKVLGMKIFPPAIARTEIAYYMTQQNPYGLPLDSRARYTKSDWICWTATLADSKEDFQKLIEPMWTYINQTPTRWPVSDWHFTDTGKARAFRARSVVGGYYMKLLDKRLENFRNN